jgi:large subunit ribosomal protein L32
MATPKRKVSKTRRDKRRTHDALKAPSLSKCPQCGDSKLPHRVCPNCGTYKGVQVLDVEGI